MLKNQVVILQETGTELLQKAALSTQAKDVREFTTLGLQCLSEVRDILDKMRHNSTLLFLECATHLRLKGNYPAYLTFCARNSLEILSETDFNLVISEIYNTKPELFAEEENSLLDNDQV